MSEFFSHVFGAKTVSDEPPMYTSVKTILNGVKTHMKQNDVHGAAEVVRKTMEQVLTIPLPQAEITALIKAAVGMGDYSRVTLHAITASICVWTNKTPPPSEAEKSIVVTAIYDVKFSEKDILTNLIGVLYEKKMPARIEDEINAIILSMRPTTPPSNQKVIHLPSSPTPSTSGHSGASLQSAGQPNVIRTAADLKKLQRRSMPTLNSSGDGTGGTSSATHLTRYNTGGQGQDYTNSQALERYDVRMADQQLSVDSFIQHPKMQEVFKHIAQETKKEVLNEIAPRIQGVEANVAQVKAETKSVKEQLGQNTESQDRIMKMLEMIVANTAAKADTPAVHQPTPPPPPQAQSGTVKRKAAAASGASAAQILKSAVERLPKKDGDTFPGEHLVKPARKAQLEKQVEEGVLDHATAVKKMKEHAARIMMTNEKNAANAGTGAAGGALGYERDEDDDTSGDDEPQEDQTTLKKQALEKAAHDAQKVGEQKEMELRRELEARKAAALATGATATPAATTGPRAAPAPTTGDRPAASSTTLPAFGFARQPNPDLQHPSFGFGGGFGSFGNSGVPGRAQEQAKFGFGGDGASWNSRARTPASAAASGGSGGFGAGAPASAAADARARRTPGADGRPSRWDRQPATPPRERSPDNATPAPGTRIEPGLRNAASAMSGDFDGEEFRV